MIEIEYKRFEGESDEELIYRVCSEKDKIGTWTEVAEILNRLTNNDFGESTYRKKYQAFVKLLNANQKIFSSTENQIREIQDLTRELNRAKIQFRDERNAWNKQNYIDARIEQKLDYLESKIEEIGRINFNPNKPVVVSSDNDLVVCASDWHIGQTFASSFGEYNSDIAKKRIQKLTDEIVRIGKINNSENVYVFMLGDQLSGNIHLSIQVSNRENVIEQVTLSSELFANFITVLSERFVNVYVLSVSGNHSRLVSEKEKDIKDERLDDLIFWIVEKLTSHIKNVFVIRSNIDNGIASVEIRGKKYIGVHGDYDNMNQNSIGKLCMMLGFIPDYILGGHRHCPAYQEFNGTTYIQSGSLAGSGDDHTIKNRLSGKASQTILVCNDKGVDAIYNVKLL